MRIKYELAIFFYFVCIVGLLCSRTLLTISMVGFVAVALFDVKIRPFRLGINPDLVKNIKRLFKRPDYLALIGIFLLVVVSFWNSDSTKDLMTDIRIKLPFLLLPLAFIQFPKLSSRQLAHVLYLFLICTSLACLGVGINYLLDYKYITNSINLGKSVPVPIHHIRFSLLVAFSVAVGLWLIFLRHSWKYTWEKRLIIALTAFVFFMQHVLSVRSGLVVMYAAIGVMAIYYIFHTKKMWLFAVILPLMAIVPLIAVQTIPTLKNKIGYLLYDLDMFSQGNRAGFSDGQRFISWYIGAEVIQENPVFGTGIGDLKGELTKKYAANYPDLEAKLPHNQFLLQASSMGITGLVAFLILYFIPLFYRRNYRFVLFASFYTIITLSFLFENTFSTAFGVGIFIFFVLLLMKRDVGNQF